MCGVSDYGHPLLFGSFLTPRYDAPADVVDLAVLCEELGLDLVTVQDHPYQPAHLDMWTLLCFIAAQTSSVHLAANVTNLPLRPPAVLARSVASLDLLSGGRIELGIGAGAFWDAIEAMGGQRLAPGESVQALEEALLIIRQLWDTDSRGGVRVAGQFHSVAGAKRGPAPAHDVDVWLGAYKQRMLALTGRLADGWLPSLAYLKPGDLAAGNAVIDEAAQAAGRSPGDIRRLLNIGGRFTTANAGALQGPPEQWAAELAELTRRDGISAFILASDDADDLRRFALDVAPAVRELVAAERELVAAERGSAAGSTPPPPRPLPPSHLPPPPVPAPKEPGAFAVVPTPDDGRRRSDVQHWDESTRPTGPAPEPGRTYTPSEQASGQHLVDIHDGLRAELAQIYDLIEQVAVGTRDVASARSAINTMTLRQNKWTVGTYCEAFCRFVTTHHSVEDQAMFPGLRRADPRLGPVIDRLQHEHVVIHDVLESLDRALVAFVAADDGVPALRAAVDVVSDTLLSHLAYEERELVEPLARTQLF